MVGVVRSQQQIQGEKTHARDVEQMVIKIKTSTVR